MRRRDFLAAAGLSAIPLPARTARPNIILIALDQLRADRLHSYGNPRATSPELDRMAAEGVRLTNLYAASPWTTPSYASIHTAQFPSRHGATLFHPPGIEGLRGDTILTAELFKKAGYRTGAFINNSNAGRFLTGRGFDDYDEAQRRPSNVTERTSLANEDFKAPATTDRVLRWLDKYKSEPFFLFLLYFEPHSPYDPPPDHDLFKDGTYPEATNTGYDLEKGRLFRQANLGDSKAVERLVQLYDGKIHFVDYHIGRLLRRLRETGLKDNTVVLLFSDHGELLYSHSEDYTTFDHRSLYDQVMHVPGLLWGADIPAGKTVDALTHHLDIAPTLLELANIPPKSDSQGKSLVASIYGGEQEIHPAVFGEQDVIERIRSVQTTRYKLIWNQDTGVKQLFDRQADPLELRNIAALHPVVVEKLTRALAGWKRENEPSDSALDEKWRGFAGKASPELVIDEVTIGSRLQLTGGGWKAADGLGNFGGGAYWTEGVRPGEALRTATWRPDNPLRGRYSVSVWHGAVPGGGSTKAAPFSVLTRRETHLVEVDQGKPTDGWKLIGEYEDPLGVRVSNEGSGRVLADAVRFLKLS